MSLYITITRNHKASFNLVADRVIRDGGTIKIEHNEKLTKKQLIEQITKLFNEEKWPHTGKFSPKNEYDCKVGYCSNCCQSNIHYCHYFPIRKYIQLTDPHFISYEG
ncbi:hypothetical protein ANME2D_02244 [Candidatus Methanoperedens nitroreducens]|uniref:Uncharacterized protein n=1 Tax=Candidatus Methanoperedens nitratireducens TaxID=1392998 RepID=A0A062V2C1_9EURY|nr:hypothetical protein ANME2D_02244 [Candidatus Methanoperedens nitroreducens]